MQKSIPRKLRAYHKPHTKFIILMDQDANDCFLLKQRLAGLCAEGGRSDSLVRIVCHELEAWFLGDLAAVEQAFNICGLAREQCKAKYRNPDSIPNAAQVLKSLVPGYQKIAGAREIAPFMQLDNNWSVSFQAFLTGIKRIIHG